MRRSDGSRTAAGAWQPTNREQDRAAAVPEQRRTATVAARRYRATTEIDGGPSRWGAADE